MKKYKITIITVTKNSEKYLKKNINSVLKQKYKNYEHILVDGNRFNPFKKTPYTCVVKGDGIYQSIAAASILAKTTRDEIMFSLHENHPQYDWDRNKGYPTKKHRSAIAKYGPTKEHRMSFNLLGGDSQLSLFK